MIESAEEFVRLRESEDASDYNRAAQDEALTEVWYTLIRDYPEMRSWVAHNKTVPLEVLELLATDESTDVRSTVAMKRKLSQELFDALARDPDESVRHHVATNAKAPISTLEKLTRDTAEFVATAAEEKLNERKST